MGISRMARFPVSEVPYEPIGFVILVTASFMLDPVGYQTFVWFRRESQIAEYTYTANKNRPMLT